MASSSDIRLEHQNGTCHSGMASTADTVCRPVLESTLFLLRRSNVNGKLCKCGNNDFNNFQQTGQQLKCNNEMCREVIKLNDVQCLQYQPSDQRIFDFKELTSGDQVAWHRWYGVVHHAIVSENESKTATAARLRVYEYTVDENEIGCCNKGAVRKQLIAGEFDLQGTCCSGGRTYCCGALYRVNNAHCFPQDEVLRRAESRVNETQYNLVVNNCEHFARWSKIGARQSRQPIECGFLTIRGIIALLIRLFVILWFNITLEVYEISKTNPAPSDATTGPVTLTTSATSNAAPKHHVSDIDFAIVSMCTMGFILFELRTVFMNSRTSLAMLVDALSAAPMYFAIIFVTITNINKWNSILLFCCMFPVWYILDLLITFFIYRCQSDARRRTWVSNRHHFWESAGLITRVFYREWLIIMPAALVNEALVFYNAHTVTTAALIGISVLLTVIVVTLCLVVTFFTSALLQRLIENCCRRRRS